jgi:hypothetical protein
MADVNIEMPTKTSPVLKLPVLSPIAPIAQGPTKPPRFPKQLIKAIPAAAEYPVKNSLGSAQNGPQKQKMPEATTHQSATASKIELGAICTQQYECGGGRREWDGCVVAPLQP